MTSLNDYIPIRIFEYNFNGARNQLVKIIYLLPTNTPSNVKDALKKLEKTGLSTLNYTKHITKEEAKSLNTFLSKTYGEKWEALLGFASETKNVAKIESQIQFFKYYNIHNFTRTIDIQDIIFRFSKCPIELQYLYTKNKKTPEPLCFLPEEKLISIGNNNRFNLPFYDKINSKLTNFKTLFSQLNRISQSENVIYFENYSNLLKNYLRDDIISDSSEFALVYQYNLSIFLPMINSIQLYRNLEETNFEQSIFPQLEETSLYSDTAQQFMKEIKISKSEKTKVIQATNFRSVQVIYKFVVPLSKSYDNSVIELNQLFSLINTTETFPLIGIKSQFDDKNIFKIFIPKKNEVDEILGRTNIFGKNNILISYIKLNSVFKYINITISSNSSMSIYMRPKKGVEINKYLKGIMEDINSDIIPQLNSIKTIIFSKFVNKINPITQQNSTITNVSVDINTTINLGGKFNKLIQFLRENIEFFFKYNPEIVGHGGFYVLFSETKSQIVFKNTSLLSFSFVDFANLDELNLYVEIIGKVLEYYKEQYSGKIEEDTSVRNLKKIDPVRFNYELEGIKAYAILVQKTKQPKVLEDKSKLKTIKNYIEIQNMTYPEQKNIYYCPTKTYPYIGFVKQPKNKYGYCLPSCFKVNPKEKKSTKVIFEDCAGNKTTTVDSGNLQSLNYIKNFESDIENGRFNYIPTEIMKILGQQPESTDFINKSTDLYLIQGQKFNSLISIMESVIDKKFVANIEKAILSNNALFEKINTKLNNKFIIPENYIEYIKNPNYLKHYKNLQQIISHLYPDLVILFLKSIGSEIYFDIIGLDMRSVDNIDLSKKRFILVNYRKKTYAPIIHYKSSEIKYIFSHDEDIVKFMFDFYKRNNVKLLEYPKKIDLLFENLRNDHKINISDFGDELQISKKDGFSIRVSKYLKPTSKINKLLDIVKFSEHIQKYGLKIKISFGYRNKHSIFMIFLNIPMCFSVDEPEGKKIKDLKISIFDYDTNENDKFTFPQSYSEYKFFNNTYKLILNGISEFLYSERNNTVRKNLETIIFGKNQNQNQNEDDFSEFSVHDILLIKTIMAIPETERLEFFEHIRFEFDSNYVNKLVEAKERNEFNSIIDELLNKLIVVIDNFPTEVDTTSKKIKIPKKIQKKIFDKIHTEIYNNKFLFYKITNFIFEEIEPDKKNANEFILRL